MEELLQQILQECRPYTGQGALASYIPELARQDPDRLGIAVFHKDGNLVEAGDSRRCFTIQSVMKPLLLLLALQDNGRETVRAHVGVEATGKPFDAINVADNALLAKHLNPMVNAGAILMCQLVGGETYDQRFARLLGFIRRLAANEKIDLDEEVYHSEKATGSKNRALAYLLKAHGLIRGDVEELLDCYFRACSIRVSAADLARIGCVLACHGQLPDGQRLFPAAYGRFVNANLMTCGMYDGSGDFAIRVGVPAKSGVGGGIIIGGKIYDGMRGAGAELGHTLLVLDGEPCTCGRRGCWEAYSSATALIRQARQAAAEHPESLLAGAEEITGKTVFDAADRGDETANAVVDRFCDYLGAGVTNIVNALAPEVILIGGGISRQGERLLAPVRRYVEKNCFGGKDGAIPIIAAARLGNDAGIIGAAAL